MAGSSCIIWDNTEQCSTNNQLPHWIFLRWIINQIIIWSYGICLLLMNLNKPSSFFSSGNTSQHTFFLLSQVAALHTISNLSFSCNFPHTSYVIITEHLYPLVTQLALEHEEYRWNWLTISCRYLKLLLMWGGKVCINHFKT